MNVVRAPGAKPPHSLPGMGDHHTAISMHASMVTALLHGERTGESSTVHMSLIANGVRAASCIAAAKFAHASDFSNHPNRATRYFTREMSETADRRWLQFAFVGSESEVRRFLEVPGVAELLYDPGSRPLMHVSGQARPLRIAFVRCWGAEQPRIGWPSSGPTVCPCRWSAASGPSPRTPA